MSHIETTKVWHFKNLAFLVKLEKKAQLTQFRKVS